MEHPKTSPTDYPELNLQVLRRLARSWADPTSLIDFLGQRLVDSHDAAGALAYEKMIERLGKADRPLIEVVTLARGAPGHSHTFAIIAEIDPDEDRQVFRALADMFYSDHIRQALQAAYVPPLTHRPAGWLWFVEAAGCAGLPDDFVIPESAIALYNVHAPSETAEAVAEPHQRGDEVTAHTEGTPPIIAFDEVADGIFVVTFRGHSATVRHKGLRISQLVTSKNGKPATYVEVDSAYGQCKVGEPLEDVQVRDFCNSDGVHLGETTLEHADSKSIGIMLRKMGELVAEKSKASTDGDFALIAECNKEIEAIEDYLSKNTYAGRSKVKGLYEKFRGKLVKAHLRALTKLEEELPDAAYHLRRAVKFAKDGVWYFPDA